MLGYMDGISYVCYVINDKRYESRNPIRKNE